MTYEPNPHDTTTNAHILVPQLVWMALQCKRPKESDITRRRDEIVLFMPFVPYETIYEPDRYVFLPLTQPDPPWTIPRGFIVGSFVLEAFTKPPTQHGALSLFMWDIAGQNLWVEGETIVAGQVTVQR
jgi:hypothetical protein